MKHNGKQQNLTEKQKELLPELKTQYNGRSTYRDEDGILRFADDDQEINYEASLVELKRFNPETEKEEVVLIDNRKPWLRRLDDTDDSLPRPSLRRFSEAVWKHGGNLTEVAGFFGVPRYTVVNRWLKNKAYKQVVEDIREALLDYAEEQLDDLVMNGNVIATIFKLKTLGKHRGYIEDSKGDDVGQKNVIKVKVAKR